MTQDAPLPGGEIGMVVSRALEWLAEGHGVAIATVVRTWGSAPRRQGSHLVVRGDGLFEGSVSGGCVEGDVLAQAQDVIASGGFRLLDYGVSDSTAWTVGLPCGGEIRVLIQAVAPGAFPPELMQRVLEAQQEGEALSLETHLESGRTQVATGEAAVDGLFVNRYPPPLRLAIVGAVHVTQSLWPFVAALGYEVKVIDPRGLFGASERFAGLPVDQRWPDEALAAWRPNAASAVVTLTHDPKLDDPALAAALRSPAFYIAALGSRRSHAARLERLAAAGFDAAALARIHGPAGLAIGAANPAEIALSIAAQMIQSWRQPSPVRSSTAA